MKALVGAFNQEKALVGAFSVIVKTDCETDGSSATLFISYLDGKADAGLLVLVNIILQLSLAELVEGDDDQGHEDVDEEEGEDNEEHNVEDGLLGAEPGDRTLVLICGCHGVLQDPEKE